VQYDTSYKDIMMMMMMLMIMMICPFGLITLGCGHSLP